MKPDFQRRIQRYGWDKAAGYYESSWQRQLKPAQDRLLERAALRPGERMLDVACGTGLVTFPAAEAIAPDGDVVGTDISDSMIEAACRIAAERGVRNVAFEQMGAEDLSLPDGAFDVALCSLGLMYVPDPLQALREMRRVLAPGGRAVAVVWGERRNCGWAEVFPIVDRRVSSDVCPLFFQLGTGDTLRQAFHAAGFGDVALERFATVVHYDSADEACTAIFQGGPVALAWDRFDEGARMGASDEYVASIATFRNGDGYDIPGEFVLAAGYKPLT